MSEKLFTVLNDTVIAEPHEIENQYSGNIIVPDLGKESTKMGKIVAIGDGMWLGQGTFVPTTLQVGDIIIIPPMNFVSFQYKGKEYYSGSERYVLCKIN
jgi:co-chaperonin GroES (HSP10)